MTTLRKPVKRPSANRLLPHLSNWNVICTALAGVDFSVVDLEDLIALELRGKCRRPILLKLLGRLHKVERDLRLAEIENSISRRDN